MQNLTASKEATLVSTQPTTAYIKTGKKVGRPKKTEEIARTNSTINQFFAPVTTGASA